MSNKVKFYHLWDWGTIWISLFATFIIALIFVSIIFYPNLINSYKQLSLDGETFGNISKVEEKGTLKHSRFGSRYNVHSFIVFYSFEVGGICYYTKSIIPSTHKVALTLNEIKASQYNEIVKVRYNKE